MSKIIGNLHADDDYTHPLGPEPNFNESMYFNFFDPTRSVGGFVRLGNRANEGYAEMTVTVFLPDGHVLFAFKRPEIADNSGFTAGGLRFDVEEAGRRLRTVYDGSVLDLAEPRRMADPQAAFVESPKRRLRLELTHEAIGPMYGTTQESSEADVGDEQGFAKAHYEQHMHVTGHLRVDDEDVAIDGFGLRDHSWGPRYWQSIAGYEWLTMNFGTDLGAMVSIVRRAGAPTKAGGIVIRGDEAEAIEAASVEIDYEPDTLYHRALRVQARTRSGEDLCIDGRVLSFLPLRNRRQGRTTHVGEGLTEWRLGTRVGFGLSELLRQVD